jgi:prevent-host-death family protein
MISRSSWDKRDACPVLFIADQLDQRTKLGYYVEMSSVNIQYAKTHLSRILEQVRKGFEVTICNRGKPFAKIVPFAEPVGARTTLLGKDRELVSFTEELADPMPEEITKQFYPS